MPLLFLRRDYLFLIHWYVYEVHVSPLRILKRWSCLWHGGLAFFAVFFYPPHNSGFGNIVFYGKFWITGALQIFLYDLLFKFFLIPFRHGLISLFVLSYSIRTECYNFSIPQQVIICTRSLSIRYLQKMGSRYRYPCRWSIWITGQKRHRFRSLS